MRQSSGWVAWLIAGLLVGVTATTVAAAPPQQDSTPSPTPTSTGFGPTPTVTPTLLPPPVGGGRVAVYELAVRIGPDESDTPITGLAYGEEVFPIGQSANGNWVAIEIASQAGWIFKPLVIWDPALNLDALPVLIPPLTITPRPTVETPESPPTPSPAQEETNTPQPSPAATEEVLPPATQTPEPSKTPASVAPTAAASTPAPPSAPDITLPSLPLPSADVLQWMGLGLVAIILAFYGWRAIASQREIKRYMGQFPLDGCPVCQTGTLHLDETIQRPLGIAHVNRSVRCDVCRSVLRQVAPGTWRYSIDPYINESLAEEFNGRVFTDAELGTFVTTALQHPPKHPEVNPDALPELTDEEILAELEARIPPPEPEEIAEAEPVEEVSEETEAGEASAPNGASEEESSGEAEEEPE